MENEINNANSMINLGIIIIDSNLSSTRVEFLEASNSGKFGIGNLDKIYLSYPVYTTRLFSNIQTNEPQLHLFLSMFWTIRQKTVLEDFLSSEIARYVLYGILGYIVIVDVRYLTFRGGERIQRNHLKTEHGIEIVEKNVVLPDRSGYFSVEYTKAALKDVQELQPDVPFVIAAINHNAPNALGLKSLHDALDISPDVPIFPCHPKNTAHIHEILLALVDMVQPSKYAHVLWRDVRRIRASIQQLQEIAKDEEDKSD
jgi:hypothetical protein